MYQLKLNLFLILYCYYCSIISCFTSAIPATADDNNILIVQSKNCTNTTIDALQQQHFETNDNKHTNLSTISKTEDENDDDMEMDDNLRAHTFGVRFYAYTNSENPDEFTELKVGDLALLQKSGLKKGKPIKIHAHGFLDSQNRFSYGPAIKNAYFKNGFENIILIDWETSVPIWESIPLVQFASYFAAIWKYLPKGCDIMKKFILFLSENQFETESMHLLGESLGAHLMGCTGYRLQTEYGLVIGRVTGLDPAGPFRENFPKENQLGRKSARFVDVVHTAIDSAGEPDAVGHVDFYSNGGLGGNQNGCGIPLKQSGIASLLASLCAHPRAPQLWQYAIEKSVYLYAYPCRQASKTSNVACARPKEFKEEEKVRFGEYGSNMVRGKYYLPITKSTIEGMKAAGINMPFAKV